MEKYDSRRWLVLIASCIINFFIGTMYVWSVFAGPMAQFLTDLNGVTVTPADLSIVFSVGNFIGFITMIGGGFLQAKFGPKLIVLIGGILFGLGFVVCGFATGTAGLIIGYGILTGLAMGLVYGCTINNTVKFFPDKKGFAGGITTAAYGISSVIWPPIIQAMMGAMDVTMAFKTVGIITIVVIVVLSFLIVKCPDGYAPQGWVPTVAGSTQAVKVEDKNWKQMLSTKVFPIMIIMLFFGAMSGMMIISQAKQIGEAMGMPVETAALVVSIIALCNTFARIIGGFVSDKIGRINTLLIVFILSVIGLLLIVLCSVQESPMLVVFIIGVCLVGISFGGFMGIYPGFTAEVFGTKNQGVNYGIMFIGFNVAGLVGPMIVSSVLASTGVYTMAFVIAAVLSVIGLVLSFVFRALNKAK